MSTIVRAGSMYGTLLSQKEGPMPVIHRPKLRKIVSKYRDIVKKKEVADYASDKQLYAQNFVMGFIGPNGGKLSFVDGSVSIDVPPGALSYPQVVYCCRIQDDDYKITELAPGVIFYSTIFGLGADEKEGFKRNISLKFRHLAKFDNEEQKKQLAAFVQYEVGSVFRHEPSFGVDVDDEFVTLSVNHFCNLGVGADADPTVIHPSRKLLVMTCLVFAENTKKTSTDLRILVGPDDEAQMRELRNVVIKNCHWHFGSDLGESKTALIDVQFKPMICSAISGLRFLFESRHFTPGRKERVVGATEMVESQILLGSTLGRDSAELFDPQAALCHITVQENSDERLERLAFDVQWGDREDIKMIQKSSHPDDQEDHADDQDRRPQEIIEITNQYYLSVVDLAPSEQT